MKNISLILILALLGFGSCGGKTEAMHVHVSHDKNVKITIRGQRTSSIEAWKVEMKVKAYDFKEGSLSFEIYAADLNDKTISVTWKDKSHAEIQFNQQDNTIRKFQLIASREQLQLAEM